MTVTTAITAGPYTFDVDRHGDTSGVPVLALHGFPTTQASWQAVADILVPRGIHLIAPLQRGYSPGARPAEVAEYAVDRLAGDAVALLDALGLEKVHLLAHDWGAAVAWSAAQAHPDRFHSVTALSIPHLAAYGWAVTHDSDAAEKASYTKLFSQPDKAATVLLADGADCLRGLFSDAVDPTIVETYMPVIGDRDTLVTALNWYAAVEGTFNQAPVTVPSTFIWSNGDRAIGRAAAERCGEFVSAQYRYIELDGSHWVPEDHPQAVADAVSDRIARA